MKYKNSLDCQNQLAETEAIDYFFSLQIVDEIDAKDNELLFHLFLALHYFFRQGHSCMPLSAIAEQQLWNEAAIDETQNDKNGYRFAELAEINRHLALFNLTKASSYSVVLDRDTLYLRRYWYYEQEVALALKQLICFIELNEKQLSTAKTLIEQLFNSDENKAQKIAVANALSNQLTIISGGPGTGKTYTVTRVLLSLVAVYGTDIKIKMAAPTGKAAQRLKESLSQSKQALSEIVNAKLINAIPDKAQTIHRLLGFKPLSTQLRHHQDNPIDCDVLLIDEASMIDLPMMVKILRAITSTTRLILLGDANQLPSVETGNILSDITAAQHPGFRPQIAEQIYKLCAIQVDENKNSAYSHLCYLDKSFRHIREIGKLAEAVIKCDKNQSLQTLNNYLADSIFKTDREQPITFLKDPEHSDSTLNSDYLQYFALEYFAKIGTAKTLAEAFKHLNHFRILVPTRISNRGVISLNQAIAKILHKNSDSHYKGRPLMVVENDYSSGLFNGDVGLIWPDEKGRLYAWFEEEEQKYRKISLSRLPANETVYAMTIHKTQGSEFNCVAIILPEQNHKLLNPKLLYTAITRAKRRLYIISSESVWLYALDHKTIRFSGLKDKMQTLSASTYTHETSL